MYPTKTTLNDVLAYIVQNGSSSIMETAEGLNISKDNARTKLNALNEAGKLTIQQIHRGGSKPANYYMTECQRVPYKKSKTFLRLRANPGLIFY